MQKIILSPKYKLLFKDLQEVRTVLLAGGRGSGKSFAGSLWLTNSFYGSKKNALYLRKFATNIESSVIPQFLSQVECLNLKFNIKKNSIENQFGKKLYFMGIESSQNSADSKLKSIPNLERVLIEEATEITEEEYTKLNLSIRDKDSCPKIILTFNPSFCEHWIYKKFYEQRGVDYDFIGVKDGVLYIHTTYLDNINNLDESFLREAENCKKYDPVKYSIDFEGKWLNYTDKALLTKQLLDLAIQKYDYPIVYDKVVVAIDPAVSTNKNSDNTRISCLPERKIITFTYYMQKKLKQHLMNGQEELKNYIMNIMQILLYMNRIKAGQMVESTLRTVLGNFVKIQSVRATKNKVIRFQPIHALYEQQLIHHKRKIYRFRISTVNLFR